MMNHSHLVLIIIAPIYVSSEAIFQVDPHPLLWYKPEHRTTIKGVDGNE
jgi:hypothetical protein